MSFSYVWVAAFSFRSPWATDGRMGSGVGVTVGVAVGASVAVGVRVGVTVFVRVGDGVIVGPSS